MRRSAVGPGLVALACVALAGCGDDDKRLTSAELTAQGNAVCVKLDAEVKKVADTFTGITFTPEQMQDFNKKLVKLVDDAVTSFKALTPPKDLEQVYESALGQLEIDRKTLDGATASPSAARKLFETQVDPFTATNQKLAAAGVTACRDNSASGDEGDGASGSPTTVATAPPTSAGEASTTSGPATPTG